jgi:hypothetical protein
MIQANNSKKNFKMLDGFKDTSVYQLLNAYEGKELKLIVSKLSFFFFFPKLDQTTTNLDLLQERGFIRIPCI